MHLATAAVSWHQTHVVLGRNEFSISVFTRRSLNSLHLISSCIRRFWWALTECRKSPDADACSVSSARYTLVQCSISRLTAGTGDAVELFPIVRRSSDKEMSCLLEPLRSTNFALNATGLKRFMIRRYFWLFLNPVRHFEFNPDNWIPCHVSWNKR